MNDDKDKQEFEQYLKDWECQGLALPKWEDSPEIKRGGLIAKLWKLLKALLESLGGLF